MTEENTLTKDAPFFPVTTCNGRDFIQSEVYDHFVAEGQPFEPRLCTPAHHYVILFLRENLARIDTTSISDEDRLRARTWCYVAQKTYYDRVFGPCVELHFASRRDYDAFLAVWSPIFTYTESCPEMDYEATINALAWIQMAEGPCACGIQYIGTHKHTMCPGCHQKVYMT